MQQRGNTKKSPNYLNAAENKFDTGNSFMNGENHQGKTSSGDCKITTPKNPLLSIICNYKYKKSYETLWPIPKYQPTIKPLPQYLIGLILQRQFFRSTHEFQYMTKSSNLKRLLVAKFFSSSTMKIRKLLGHKTLGVKMQQLLQRE